MEKALNETPAWLWMFFYTLYATRATLHIKRRGCSWGIAVFGYVTGIVITFIEAAIVAAVWRLAFS